MQVAIDSELPLDGDIVAIEDGASEPAADDADSTPIPPSKKRAPALWHAMLFGLAVVTALAVLVGWLGFRVHQSQQAQAERSRFLEVARQGALNLTTIDWQHADADVHRILDGATGEFYDDFAHRSQPFIDVVKQAKAKTVGTVTEAGLESETTASAHASGM